MDFRWKKEELKTETLVLAFMRGVNGFEIFHRGRGEGRGGLHVSPENVKVRRTIARNNTE